MENATKALYMAAGVFIGVLILTAMIFVFRQGGQMLETLDNNNQTLAMEKYNSELIIYNKPGDEESYNTIFDVVTACNLAYDINEQNMYDKQNYLEIDVNINGILYQIINDPTKSENGKIYNSSGLIPLSSLINLPMGGGDKLSEVTQTGPDGKGRDYKYKFEGNIINSDYTTKINKIIFTLK